MRINLLSLFDCSCENNNVTPILPLYLGVFFNLFAAIK